MKPRYFHDDASSSERREGHSSSCANEATVAVAEVIAVSFNTALTVVVLYGLLAFGLRWALLT